MRFPMLLMAMSSSWAAPLPAADLPAGYQLVPGRVPLDWQGPDGNTIVIDAPKGLIVVDTGRSPMHVQKILDLAGSKARPIAAIINTHWHLDHSSGNRRLRAVYPDAPVFTTNAIDRALSPEGFLTINRNEAQLRAMLDDPNVPEIRKDEIRNGLATMHAPDSLRPTVSMQRSGRYNFARRRLDVRQEPEQGNGLDHRRAKEVQLCPAADDPRRIQ